MSEWRITLTFTDYPGTALEALNEELEVADATVGGLPDLDQFTVTLYIHGATAPVAMRRAVGRVRLTLQELKLPGELVRAEAWDCG